MEYFIVSGERCGTVFWKSWRRRCKEGVEVRVMYDGMCCLMLLPYAYPKTLREKGIKCKMFSPIRTGSVHPSEQQGSPENLCD